jgi:hypothetical protein
MAASQAESPQKGATQAKNSDNSKQFDLVELGSQHACAWNVAAGPSSSSGVPEHFGKPIGKSVIILAAHKQVLSSLVVGKHGCNLRSARPSSTIIECCPKILGPLNGKMVCSFTCPAGRR